MKMHSRSSFWLEFPANSKDLYGFLYFPWKSFPKLVPWIRVYFTCGISDRVLSREGWEVAVAGLWVGEASK